MEQGLTVLLAGGGTGGHLYPGIAVAEALVRALPEVKPLFLCTTREIDRIILEPTGYEYMPQAIVPPVRTIAGLLRFWRSWRETKDLVRRVMKDRRPAAVVGLGGYAAGVAVKSAANRKIHAAILNPDVIPGKANQYLMRHVQAICCQFEVTREHIAQSQRQKIHVTGCPIRSDIRELPAKAQAAERLGLDPMLHTLVITGASQGAQTVNEGVLAALEGMKLQGWQVLHLAGRDHGEAVRTGYRERGIEARVIDFTPAMVDVWAVADLCVSRAGASSCAELTACGVPSVLLPYPFHKDMHQRANGQVLADAGAAVLLEDRVERRANAEALRPVLSGLMYDAGRRKEMGEAAKTLGRPDAAERVAEVVRGLMSA